MMKKYKIIKGNEPGTDFDKGAHYYCKARWNDKDFHNLEYYHK